MRTFAPFVAGVGKMHYGIFLSYNIVGGFIWVTSLTFAGYFFGQIPLIKNNFEYVVMGIVFISILPILTELIKHKYVSRNIKNKEEKTSYGEIQETFKKEGLSD